MQLGAMNDPRRDLVEELSWIAEAGFDFVDLTLEPPKAYVRDLDHETLGREISRLGLGVVTHCYCMMPIGSPLAALRAASVAELRECLAACPKLGAEKMTVHLDGGFSLSSEHEVIRYNAEVLATLVDDAKREGVTVMAEHFRGPFARPDAVARLLDAVPGLAFHLDVGHANLFGQQNRTKEFLEKCGARLAHVHFSDNRGGRDDLHLPVGTGTVDWSSAIKELKKAGYDGTITLEVFAQYRDYLIASKSLVEALWTRPETKKRRS